MKSNSRLRRGLAVATVVSALGAPAASAAPVEQFIPSTVDSDAGATVDYSKNSATGDYAPATKDLRSPDARDAATQAAKVEMAQDLRSPDARDAGLPEAPTSDTIVEIREVPGSGFDWGDAGIGAAGLLAMVSIAGGVVLMLTTRRRRRGTEMPAH